MKYWVMEEDRGVKTVVVDNPAAHGGKAFVAVSSLVVR
jgi:hypothetical protein